MLPVLRPLCSPVGCNTRVDEKNGANACASFNGSVHLKGVQGGIGGTTKTTTFEAHLLHCKGENGEARCEYDLQYSHVEIYHLLVNSDSSTI